MSHVPAWYERAVVADADRLSDALGEAQRRQGLIGEADQRTAPARFAIRALGKGLTERELFSLLACIQARLAECPFSHTDTGVAVDEALTDAIFALENAE